MLAEPAKCARRRGLEGDFADLLASFRWNHSDNGEAHGPFRGRSLEFSTQLRDGLVEIDVGRPLAIERHHYGCLQPILYRFRRDLVTTRFGDSVEQRLDGFAVCGDLVRVKNYPYAIAHEPKLLSSE
jgi:hypothetical protein